MEKSSKVVKGKSQINYSYATIKVTQSRIDKGLIVIPVPLSKWFPDHNDTIQIYLNDSPASQTKRYSSYNSSTRECRIGGMKQWFHQNNIRSGDEIVIQPIDKEHFIYKLIPERNFILKTKELQDSFDDSENDQEASEKIETLAEWTHLDKGKVSLNEYYRLISILTSKDRQYTKRISVAKESAPANLRTLLEYIYKGHCQICDFWFLKKDKRPYFEIHHLEPLKGHHPKNLLVVCGNCHNQFEYTHVKQEFNNDSWLVRVAFNNNAHLVNQVMLSTKVEGFFKELFI